MELPASYEALRPVVEHEYFDHRAVPQLQDYVKEQVETKTYDFEANKALLKLYQFFPDLMQEEIVAQMLAKALMNVASSDFAALMYIVPPRLHQMEPVISLKRCSTALETASYADFWQTTTEADMPTFLPKIPGFLEGVRVFIANSLAATFQDVSRDYLEQCLDLGGADLEVFLAEHANTLSLTEDGQRAKFSPNRYNQIQPKKFKEAVEFDKMLHVISKLN